MTWDERQKAVTDLLALKTWLVNEYRLACEADRVTLRKWHAEAAEELKAVRGF